MNSTLKLTLAALFFLGVSSDLARAGRGGFRGGGGGGGGGGGYGGGGRGGYGGGGYHGNSSDSGGYHGGSSDSGGYHGSSSNSGTSTTPRQGSTNSNAGAAAAGAGYSNRNQQPAHPNAAPAAAGAGYANRNQQPAHPNAAPAAAGAGYANRNQGSAYPNAAPAAAGAGYANRNQGSAYPNAAPAAAGAGYANRNNQSAYPNAGAAAAGAGYANRNNQSAYPNAGAAAAGAAYANNNQGSAYPNAGAAALGAGYANANQPNWYNGAWNGNYGGSGAYGAGGAAAMPAIGSWANGSSLYNMGYSSYSNPFNGAGAAPPGTQGDAAAPVAQGSPYNYAQPIDTTAAPPQQAAADQGTSLFGQARDAFKGGDYAQALSLCDQALKQTPNDRTLHEFRGAVLFALQRYDESAKSLYAVLSAGPGWDWTTMSGLYPSTDVFTGQLRTLETYSQQNPNSASARFVLGYLYVMTGANNDAVAEFEWVAKLQPGDTLAPKLVQMFTKGDQNGASAAQPSAAPAAQTYNLAGNWAASPAQGVNITLTIQQDGPYSWKVADKGKTRKLDGKSTYENGLLTLTGTQGPPLTGKVTWQDENNFTFQVAGGGTLNPGLKFAR